MNKFKIALLSGIFLIAGLLLLPLAGVAYAKRVCFCDGETPSPANASAAVPAMQDAPPAPLASRSGISQDDKQFVTYTVKPGDTLSKLARDYNTDVDTIIALNNITDPRALRIGQPLTIPNKLKQEEIPAVTGIEKIMTFTLTAYTAGPESTGKSPGHPAYGITATGKRATEGRTIAVDPKVIPYGSRVYIEGVGIRTAEDTGGAIRGNRIDVYMEDLGQAIRFGRKENVRVYVLSSPNA